MFIFDTDLEISSRVLPRERVNTTAESYRRSRVAYVHLSSGGRYTGDDGGDSGVKW